ncbi:hypothetical protein MXB_4684 [Myxobolus squamalis]|nr:hypothetical protein MXB_4684 [Myxobolus squamalis]
MSVILDSRIRLWVILPLTVINLCLCVIRSYAALLFSQKKNSDIYQLRVSETAQRVKICSENCGFIPKEAFESRRHYFNTLEGGYLDSLKRPSDEPVPNMFNDPNALMGMMKNNMVNVVIMIIFGQWVNSTLSGFIRDYRFHLQVDSNQCFKAALREYLLILLGLARRPFISWVFLG